MVVSGFSIQDGDAVFGANPYLAGFVFFKGPHGVVGQAVWKFGVVAIGAEMGGVHIQAVQAAKTAYPQYALPILKDAENAVVADGKAPVRLVGIDDQIVDYGLVTNQSLAVSTGPERVVLVEKKT